jgi:hypothetical protein
MERVRKLSTLPTTLIVWGGDPFVLAAPALDARGASAEQVVRIPITQAASSSSVRGAGDTGADTPRFRV